MDMGRRRHVWDVKLVRVAQDPSKTTFVWDRHHQPQDDYMKRFVSEYICKHEKGTTLLQNLASLYVLVGMKQSGDDVGTDWVAVLPADSRLAADMERYECCPLAMVLVSRSGGEGHFVIEWVESFLRGHNFGAKAVRYVEGELDATGIPLDIAEAYDYWVPILKDQYGTVAAMKDYFAKCSAGIEWKELKGYHDHMFDNDGDDEEVSSSPPPQAQKKLKR